MSRKEKSLHEKVKQFFGRKEAVPLNFDKLKKEPYNLTSDALKDISSENSQSHRLRSLKELYDIVLTKKLENYAVEALCRNVEDLLDSQHNIETRHIVLQFYSALIHGQLEHLTIMRSYLFKLLANHTILEDTSPRLDMLKALSENGKTITYFEEEIDKTAEFLSLVTNVIKFNAAYLNDSIISGFIEHTCILCSSTKVEEEIQESLNILDAILCYSHIPDYVLQHFIYTLCITVNIEKFSQCSWKQMRNLLGTNVGHRSIFTLCLILQDIKNYNRPSVVRGAIFYVGMALWGSNRVSSLIHPPSTVLPAFLKVLDSNDIIIAYEVILSLQRLVKKNGDTLQSLSWDVIFDIVEKVLEYPEVQSFSNPMPVLAKSVHDLITVIEENSLEFCHDRLFKIIESCADARNENSVIRLIKHNTEQMHPFKLDFIANMTKLLEKFFKNDKRLTVQLEVIKVIQNIRLTNGNLFEDDLMDQSILQFMLHIDSIPEAVVRKAAVELLINIAESCTSTWFFDILDIIGKQMKLMFASLLEDNALYSAMNKDSLCDVIAAVEGLISIFKKKLLILPSHCTGIYDLLINHIKEQYQNLLYLNEAIKVRKLILEFFLQLRANNQKQLGICVNGAVEYSLYISCDYSQYKETVESVPASPPPCSPSLFLSQTISYLNFGDAFQAIISCLKQERDWSVLELVLRDLPLILQNKSLIIRGNCSVSALCATLCTMVNDKNMGFPESLKNVPLRLTRTEVQSHIFPCISALTSYHSYMEPHIQRLLIRCLQSGLVSRSAKICMEGLTLCTLEMQNSMVKLLPDVLLKLSKISATVGVAVSVLEFLSNLIRLPHLYVSFVEDQYMSIFAIALPYTNPFKFCQYTVALAHHVIAMWFLKCRIPFRKDFAKFITKGLRSNINIPCDENQSTSSRNEDPSRTEEKAIGKDTVPNSAIISLHTELMETGLDLMARFTFGMASNVPKRSPVSDFLLERGQKTSWLVGNKIVTITTSGCGTKSFKHGLCERCYITCRDINKSSESDENDSIFAEPTVIPYEQEHISFERKRHRSAVQRRSVTLSKEMFNNAHSTKDDIHLLFQRSQRPDESSCTHTPLFINDDASLCSSYVDWSSETKDKDDKGGHLCSCWCTSWSEVHIRRPTGNTSWMMKIQNQLFLPSSPPDIPLCVLTSLVLPQKKREHDLDNCNLSSTEEECLDILESELTKTVCDGGIAITPSLKPHPPMRRTNSSPDMNTGWSNFESFEKDQEKGFLEAQNDLMDVDFECEEKLLLKDNCSDISSSAKKLKTKQNLRLNLTDCEKTGRLSESSRLLAQQDGIYSAPAENVFNFNSNRVQSSLPGSFRDRGHTISVMSPIYPTGSEISIKRPEISRRSGMSPSFVFLQLFHNSCFGPASHKPLLLLQTETNNRALNVLDHIPPYDTHKIGVVYVGPGQVNDEVAILNNLYGSARYVQFLRGLGNLVHLTDVDPHTTYLGGLDTRGEDGKFALIWHDDVMQVVFHVATLMCNKESDAMRNEKKKHIANDNVMIVYNESAEDYKLSTIKGHVTNVCIIISPEDFNCNIVSVKHKTKELLETFGHSELYIVSDESLPVFVRQMALHANLASLIISRKQQSNKYSHVSNWLERLRTIKRLRSKVLDELQNRNEGQSPENLDSVNYDDFTDYV